MVCGTELCDLDNDRAIIYRHGAPEGMRDGLIHSHCYESIIRIKPSLGSAYEIILRRIVDRGDDANPFANGGGDSLAGWTAHLRQKKWFWPDMALVLEWAHRVARNLRHCEVTPLSRP